jgi:thiol-disulfide isomerase/thioredoxin
LTEQVAWGIFQKATICAKPNNYLTFQLKQMAKKSKKKSPEVLEVTLPEGFGEFFTPIAIILSAIVISISIIYTGSKLTADGETLGAKEETVAQEETQTEDQGDQQQAQTPPEEGTFETFTQYDTERCEEDGKPMVFLFSTTWCPHCQWISDTFDSWAKDNSDKISAYHWEVDINDDTLTEEEESEIPSEHQEIFEKFNPNGSIPTFVFGCEYARVGNGYEAEDDLDKERESFNAVVDKLI